MAVDWADCGGSWNVPSHYGEAEKLERQTLEIQRRILGPDHPDTAMSTYNLGGIALHKGKSAEALSLLREAIDHGLAPNIAVKWKKIPISQQSIKTRASPPWSPTPRTAPLPRRNQTSRVL